MDWIVFGDDWGVHPSTTQHLILNMPASDKVIWVDSIGMRAPRMCIKDGKRIINKIQSFLKRKDSSTQPIYSSCTARFTQIKPKVIPYHLNEIVRRFNSIYLHQSIKQKMKMLNMSIPNLLAAVPSAVYYFDAIPHNKIGYLRLDQYDFFPGTDPKLVYHSESEMFKRATHVFCTAKSLLPKGEFLDKGHYLPQGVDIKNFAKTSLAPSKNKILGFYGLISDYVDFDLVLNVARALPDWKLEFVGSLTTNIPKKLQQKDNIHFLPKVPWLQLPNLLSNWTAAWAPYLLTEHTLASNPLKVREYLASGVPSHCTPIPEVKNLKHLFISKEAHQIIDWLQRLLQEDKTEKRIMRRQSVKNESWSQRCDDLKRVMRHL